MSDSTQPDSTQTTSEPFSDPLSALADAATQKTAARLAQDVFAESFRLAAAADVCSGLPTMAEIEGRCRNWCEAGAGDEGRALRLAMLVAGLDQWGLAYSQAFNLTALPALSSLLGALRTGLEASAEARFQWFFAQIDEIESAVIDFKIELRRSIHLALWHAMAACADDAAAQPVLQALGSLLVALEQRMPTLGWRLVADALASMQLCLLGDSAASAVAQHGTQQLIAALRQTLPAARYQAILAHSGKAVLAWQQARRNTTH